MEEKYHSHGNEGGEEEKTETPAKPIATANKKKKKRYSENKILEIVSVGEAIDNNLAVGRYFGVPEPNVRRWREKYKDFVLPPTDPQALSAIRSETKSTRKPLFENLEQRLFEWIKDTEEESSIIARRD